MIDRRLFLLGAAALGLDAGWPGAARAGLDPHGDAAPRPALPAQFGLAVRLLLQLDPEGPARPSRLLVSPMSAVAALSLIATGADAGLAASIATLAGVKPGASPAETSLALARLARASLLSAGPFTSAGRLVLDPALGTDAGKLKTWASQGLPVNVQDLADPAVVTALNAWVNQVTKGLIPSILDEAPGRGGVVALNALHFKDRWRTPFEPDATRPGPFLGMAGSRDVPLMTRTGPVRTRTDPATGLVAVDLPFADPRFRIAFVTHPEPHDASRLVRLGSSLLTGKGFAVREVELVIPRLDLSASTELLPPLTALGLDAGGKAGSLSGFGTAAPAIRSVAQKTVFTMDEQGAEAAAATAVVATRSLVERTSLAVRFDRPFLFALRDTRTGFVVLAGWVDLAAE